MSNLSNIPERTPNVVKVLDTVRRTGLSAHDGGAFSTVVLAVAISEDLNPVELQAEVDAYARAIDRFNGVTC